MEKIWRRSTGAFGSAPSRPYQCQSLPAELQSCNSVRRGFFLLTIAFEFALCPTPGWVQLPGGWDEAAPGTDRGSQCSAGGGSSSASGLSCCGSGGMRSCTSSELMATLSGCSQRFRCSSVLGTARGHRETASDTATHGHSTGIAAIGISCPSAGMAVPKGEVWRGMDLCARGDRQNLSFYCHSLQVGLLSCA